MQKKKYLYSIGCADNEIDLCLLESKYLFGQEGTYKIILSDIVIQPSSSAFIKSRINIISTSNDYPTLVDKIKKHNITSEGFKVEYLVLKGDTTGYADRLQKLRDIGYSITGKSDYYSPTITYAICNYADIWYFGILIKNGYIWKKHKQKPYSYSNSISMSIAKALINIASGGDKDLKIIDACCGVGTIMLEACFVGYDIEGCDINWKLCNNARDNISYFDYSAHIHTSDVKDIKNQYDAAVIDLPYNLLSTISDGQILDIIESTAEISNRLVIVSTLDISKVISKVGLILKDYCTIGKKGNTKFSRKIWVCEKD